MKKLFIPPVFVLTGILINVFFWLVCHPLNIIPFPYNLGGIFICMMGISIFGNAVYLFKKNSTTLQLKKPSSFIKNGIYAKSRNPIYLGTIIFLFGWAVCLQNIFGFLIPYIFFILIRRYFIPFEEQMMEDCFKQEYMKYKNDTPKWI